MGTYANTFVRATEWDCAMPRELVDGLFVCVQVCKCAKCYCVTTPPPHPHPHSASHIYAYYAHWPGRTNCTNAIIHGSLNEMVLRASRVFKFAAASKRRARLVCRTSTKARKRRARAPESASSQMLSALGHHTWPVLHTFPRRARARARCSFLLRDFLCDNNNDN